MDDNLEVLVDEPKRKLARLNELMRGDPAGAIFEFGRIIAEQYLGDDGVAINPFGFVMAAGLAVDDIRVGINQKTGNPIESFLVRQPSMVFNILIAVIPRIADAIFDEEFAAAVRVVFDRIYPAE